MDERFLSFYEESFKRNWNRPALSDLEGASYQYKDFARKIKELHILFAAMGVNPGDKISICGKNSPHWAISFFATVSYGAVVVTILHDFHADSIQDIVNHSESVVFFADSVTKSKVKAESLKTMKHIVLMEDFSIVSTTDDRVVETCKSMNDIFNAKYPEGLNPEKLDFYRESPEELAVLNYTSGTMSSPKGVMLPYRSLWSNTRFAVDNISFVKPGDGLVCMLPMAHMYGLAFEVLLSLAQGCHIHFLGRAPSPQVLLKAFQKVQPTLVLAVPLIIEKIVRGKIFPELEKKPASILLKLPILRNVVYKKVREKLMETFGGKLHQVVIGGAGLNSEGGDFLTKIGFPYSVGYGMTECGPLISYEYWTKYKPGCCGKAVNRMQVKIDSADPEQVVGEILVKGANTMMGYYKNPEATKLVFTDDGWLRTGDLATMDKEGYIFIKGRNKSMILGANGQNIYPEEIEEKFNNEKYVLESLIVERNHKLEVIIVPDTEVIEKENIGADKLKSIFSEMLETVNNKLPNYSKVVNFELRDSEFEKTPKRSIRRFLYK
ncbi:MAG: long-chain fatty acid--CoA ligase [Bacteroidales bacterium 45-6]|nr:MAG: long-chain fatty acid--CoA ligase [Bacteroidales bacterium 45-6]